MYKSGDYTVAQSSASELARQTLMTRILAGKERQQELLQSCANNVPRDRYVPPSRMLFLYSTEHNPSRVTIRYSLPDGKEEFARIHSHALGQLADTSGLTRAYLNRLNQPSEAWRLDLLAHNLNELFGNQEFRNKLKQPAEFLHRLIGNELRGFLTQSFNRHLLSMPLLGAFIEVCKEMGAAPVSALITDTRVGLQCYLPYVFEPVVNEFVAVGVWWGNSDFGEGKLKVSHSLMRIRVGTSVIMEDSYSRVHLGSVVRDTDIKLGDEVAIKEVDTAATAIQSAVREILKPESVNNLLALIEKAHSEDIPWRKLKGKLGKYLSNDELSRVEQMLLERITDLPQAGLDKDGNPLASRWWSSAALSLLAERESNAERSAELKQASGILLGVAKDE